MVSRTNSPDSVLLDYIKNLIQVMTRKLSLSLFLMVLISLTEGLSIILLIPLLGLVGLDVGTGSLGQISIFLSSFFHLLGLPLNLVVVLSFYVLIVCVNALFSRWQILASSDLEYDYGNHMRQELYALITRSTWLFLATERASDLAHALTNEVERISIGTYHFLSLLSSTFILIVYLLFTLSFAGLLTVIIFLVGLMLFILLRKKTEEAGGKGEDITFSTRDLYQSILQHLQGMKTIKTFSLEEENIKTFSNKSREVASSYLGAVRNYADVKLFFDTGSVFFLAMLVLVMVEFLKIPTATLLLLIYLFVRMIPQFSTIQHTYQFFLNMLPAYGNIRELERKCQEAREVPEKKIQNIQFKESIKLEDLVFSYPQGDFNLNIDHLEIGYGKTTAIVGPSGAGKSTLADVIMALHPPDQGKFQVDGQSLEGNLFSWRQKIGYVAQETFLFNDTIRNNLLLAREDATEEDLYQVLRLAAAQEFVEHLPQGLDTVIGDRGVRLSGGERQRLALARAFLREPSLLILDEATSNLDSENEKRILQSIEKLHGDLTILIIAHRLSTIRHADQIYLLEKGRIMESGTWDELIRRKERFWRLCQNQGLL